MERSPCVEQPGIELLSPERVARSRCVEERALARFADEHDRGGRRSPRITYDRVSGNAAGVEQVEQEVPERVGADLAGDGRLQSEPRERARGVERAAASMEGNLVDKAERSGRRHVVDRTRDHVRDEDAEADDVGHAAASGSGARQRRSSRSPSTASFSARAGTAKASPGPAWLPSMYPCPASTRSTQKRPAGSAARSAQKNERAASGRASHRLVRLEIERLNGALPADAEVAVFGADREPLPLAEEREVGRLLQLGDEHACAERMRKAGGHVHGVAGAHADPIQRAEQRVRVLLSDQPKIVLLRDRLAEADPHLR